MTNLWQYQAENFSKAACEIGLLDQRHRTVEVGRDLWRLPGASFLLKQGQWEQVEQG